MRAALYVRVSTAEQAAEGRQSLDLQEEACRGLCRARGWEVVEVYREEGESARTTDRTQLQRLLTEARRRRIEVVVVHQLSRLARESAGHWAIRVRLSRDGVELRSVTEPVDDSPAGRLLEAVIAGISEFDNSTKAARSREGMRRRVEQGAWCWRAPVGYRRGPAGGPSLVPGPRAHLVRGAFERVARGESLADVARWLEASGMARRVRCEAVRRLISSPAYRGRLEVPSWSYDGLGDWEALVSDELWCAAQHPEASGRVGGGPRPLISHQLDHPGFPLRRWLHCADCDRPVTGSTSRGAARRHSYYHCIGCGSRTPAQDVHGAWVDHLEALELAPAIAATWRQELRAVWLEDTARERTERRTVEQRVEDLRRRRRTLAESWLAGDVDRDVYDDLRSELATAETIAVVELERLRTVEVDLDGLLAAAERLVTDVAGLWATLDLPGRRRLQALVAPEGASYEWRPGRIRTAATARIFSALQQPGASISQMVPPTGFEPVSSA